MMISLAVSVKEFVILFYVVGAFVYQGVVVFRDIEEGIVEGVFLGDWDGEVVFQK